MPMKTILLFIFFVFAPFIVRAQAQYHDTVNVYLTKCKGDRFRLFSNTYVGQKISNSRDASCQVHNNYNEPNNDEFEYDQQGFIGLKDTTYNYQGYKLRFVYYIEYEAIESTTLTINNVTNIKNSYADIACVPGCESSETCYGYTSTTHYIVHLSVIPQQPQATISAQTIVTNPNTPENVQLTANGCTNNEGTFWTSNDPDSHPYYTSTNVTFISTPYNCFEYKARCANLTCPQYSSDWSEPKSAAEFQHTQKDPGYSPTFSDYLTNQRNKSKGKPEYAYRWQLACIQQKSRQEYTNTGEDGWAGGFVKHNFDKMALMNACEFTANYKCKELNSQAICLEEAGDLHGKNELFPNFFNYQPSGDILGIPKWTEQHEGFLTNAVAVCFDQLAQDSNYLTYGNSFDTPEAIDAFKEYVLEMARFLRNSAQGYFIISNPYFPYGFIFKTLNLSLPANLQNQFYSSLPSPLTKPQLFSQTLYDTGSLKVTAIDNSYFVKTNTSVQLNVVPAGLPAGRIHLVNEPTEEINYQLSVDSSIATISTNGLLTIHSTNQPLFNGRLPIYVFVTSNGKTGVGQFAIYDTDNDGDLISDTYETKVGLNPAIKNDLKTDSDGDDLLDFFEVNLGSDPLKKDTDGDGYSDLEEYLEMTLATSDASFPDYHVYVSMSSGDWTNPINWSCNCIPSLEDKVIVRSGHKINVTQVMGIQGCKFLKTEPGGLMDVTGTFISDSK